MKLRNASTLLTAVLILAACGKNSRDSKRTEDQPRAPVPEGNDAQIEARLQQLDAKLATAAAQPPTAAGDVVICQQGDKQKIETLEEYENRIDWRFTFDLETIDMPSPMRASRIVKRIEPFDNLRSDRLRNEVAFFFDRIEYFTAPESRFAPNNTSTNGVGIGSGCLVASLTVPRESSDTSKKLFINKGLWEKMSEDSRTLYILRKTFEGEIEDKTAIGALKARYFVTFLASKSIPLSSGQSYFSFLKKLGVSPAVIFERNLALFSESVEFNENGKLAKAQIAADAKLKTEYATIKLQKNDFVWFGADEKLERVKVSTPVQVQILSCSFAVSNTVGGDESVSFHSNGMVKTGKVNDVCLQVGNEVRSYLSLAAADSISFYPTGAFKKGCLEMSELLPVAGTTAGQSLQNVAFQGSENNDDTCLVEMSDKGLVKRGVLHEEATLITVNGILKKYPALSRLNFDEAGRVVDAE